MRKISSTHYRNLANSVLSCNCDHRNRRHIRLLPHFGNRVGWLAATGCCIFPISLACNSAHSPSVTRPSLSAIFRRSTTQLSKITLRSTLTLFTQFSQSFHTAAFEVQVHTVFTKIIHTEICVLFTSDVMRYALSDGQSITGYLFVSPPLTLRLHYVLIE